MRKKLFRNPAEEKKEKWHYYISYYGKDRKADISRLSKQDEVEYVWEKYGWKKRMKSVASLSYAAAKILCGIPVLNRGRTDGATGANNATLMQRMAVMGAVHYESWNRALSELKGALH